MKYQGIPLLPDTDAELRVSVKITGNYNNSDMSRIMRNIINALSEKKLINNNDIIIEQVLDNYLLIKCDDITFDQKGIDLLSKIFHKVKSFNLPNVETFISVHIDMDNWFEEDDGYRYNEKTEKDWKEFLNNLTY